MKFIYKYKILFLLIFLFKNGIAQELGTNLYLQDKVLINPANAGDHDGIYGFMNYRNQMIGLEGAPNIGVVGLHGNLTESKNMGFGGMVVAESQGFNQKITGIINYSYKLTLSEGQTLSFGLAGSFADKDAVRSKIIAEDKDGATLMIAEDDSYQKTIYGFGFGLSYRLNNFQIGFSMPEMLDEEYALKQYIVFNTCYKWAINENLDLIPSLLYRTIPTADDQYDLGIMAVHKKDIWGQVIYRQFNDASYVIVLGTNMGNFKMGYSYEINSNDLSTMSDGSFEIILGYNFGNIKKNEGMLDKE